MSERGKWFREARWGVFTHYLADRDLSADEWNRRVDAFDVKKLAEQLASIDAPYYFMTLGQNSGHFCSPNKTYDSLVGRCPSHCSQRDLIGDIIEAIEPYEIRMMVYLPSHAPALDRQAVEGLKCTPQWDPFQWQLKPGMYLRQSSVDEKLSEFQNNWQAIIAEWSNRWKTKVHGWWFDGCYYADKMYRHSSAPNFESFAAAARAGNKDSIVAFNTGVHAPVRHVTKYEDYTAGEIADVLPYDNAGWIPSENQVVDGRVNGTQYHILSYIGEYWCKGAPRFSPNFLKAYTQHISDLSGTITWDVPISSKGEIPNEYIELLGYLNSQVD